MTYCMVSTRPDKVTADAIRPIQYDNDDDDFCSGAAALSLVVE